VDPLDGTKEFIAGSEEFTVNIALIEQGRVVFGVVSMPTNGRLLRRRRAWARGVVT
jgi:3'(2'), 5'-bisphosphate nucleotidase